VSLCNKRFLFADLDTSEMSDALNLIYCERHGA
jgi:hypothetical protein